jgi:hypothetical protein
MSPVIIRQLPLLPLWSARLDAQGTLPTRSGRCSAHLREAALHCAKIARMHLTQTELNLLPDVIALVAVMGGCLGVVSSNRNAMRLARGAFWQERLTETYLDLLKGVHARNAQLDDSYTRPLGKPPRTPTEADPTAGDEAVFGARLLAYASAEVDRMWGEFAALATKFDNLLIATRQATGLAPIDVHGSARQPVEEMYNEWKRARDELQARIRSELRRMP